MKNLYWWDTIAVDEFFAQLKEIQSRNRWIEDIKERLHLVTTEDLY